LATKIRREGAEHKPTGERERLNQHIGLGVGNKIEITRTLKMSNEVKQREKKAFTKPFQGRTNTDLAWWIRIRPRKLRSFIKGARRGEGRQSGLLCRALKRQEEKNMKKGDT